MSHVTEGQLREIIALKAYRDPVFRRQLLINPKAMVESIIGTSLGNVRINIVEDTENDITMVIPPVAFDELPLH